jgi:transposase
MKIQLTQEQKKELESQHRKERDSKVCDRIKAVLLSSEGWTQSQIAQALRIHETTVAMHIQEYLDKNKLKNESGGSSSKLTVEQTNELICHLEKNTYPDTKKIIAYVQNTYAVKYTQQGMYNWLKHNKFSYKAPKGVPLKCDIARQNAFKEKYNKLKSNLGENEKILFMDSVHPTQATKITSGWIRKGVEKMIATVAGRSRLNLTGAIDLESMSIFTREYKTIDGKATIDFLKDLDKSTDNTDRIHLIADGGGAHTCKDVGAYLGIKDPFNRKYLEDNYQIKLPADKKRLTRSLIKQLKQVFSKEPEIFVDKEILNMKQITTKILMDAMRKPLPHKKFVLHILPPYSPNLNPIERVWKVMNEHVRNNEVFSSFKEFKVAILDFFKNEWNAISNGLRTRINDHFEKLKPVF